MPNLRMPNLSRYNPPHKRYMYRKKNLMPQITLHTELKAQLIGWLNREKDHLLSIVAMSERIVTPRRTGTLDMSRADLESITKLRQTLRGRELVTELTEEEADMLIEAGELNPHNNRIGFWQDIKKAITQ